MKILYLGTERGAAERIARELHETAPHPTVAWSHTVQSALRWVHENLDAAAVIVGSDVHALSCAAFIDQVQDLQPTMPVVVVVAPAHIERTLALTAGAAGYALAGPSLQADLPRIIAAAVDRERSRREILARKLTDLETAHTQAVQRLERAVEARQQAERQRASEQAAAAAQLADLQAGQSACLAREARICTALQEKLLEAEDAVRKADDRRASESVAFADTLTKRHAEFTASLALAARSRDALAVQLAAATAALDEAQQARRADAAAAAERLQRRDAEATAALAEAAAARTALETALAQAEAAHRDAQQRSDADLAAANERQAALEDLLAQEADRRATLEQKLAAVQAAHQDAQERHTTELTRALARLAEVQARYEAALDEGSAARGAFERRLTEAASALERATRERSAEAAATAEQFAHREAELVARVAGEADARAAVERELASTRTEMARGRRRLLYVVSAHRRRGREQQARLATTQDQLQRVHGALDEERRAYEHARTTSESELQRLSGEYDRLSRSFEHLQAAFQALEQIAGEHAAERARLETVVTDRENALSAQAERFREAERSAQDALTQVQEKLDASLEASASDVARLNHELGDLRVQLDATRGRAEALRADAERAPGLQAQLEASQKERRRQFERAPFGLCRCTPDGVITEANHAFAAMLGRRRADELRNMDFAAAVSDSAGDLGWLFERTRAVRKTEDIETDWKTRDGRHLAVRLHALATAEGSIEIVVEDVTGHRALEDRLRQAERLEAVGRLASEVAVTCDALLRDVMRDAREWLTAFGSDDAARRRGEGLLSELTRAASFLRQLAAYGNEQERAFEPASVQRALRDLAPVLKHVVGDDIELVLPKASGPFDVDLDAARLQRMLVNVAGFARERMPHGGQMRIDLTTTVIGRRFIARYPSVRPGPHVLMTVTELPADDPQAASPSADRPGVDLGALVDLVGSCGGHLWMEAQPAGNMMLKIHLPKPSAVRDPGRPASRPGRGGRLARWLRTTSAAVRRP